MRALDSLLETMTEILGLTYNRMESNVQVGQLRMLEEIHGTLHDASLDRNVPLTDRLLSFWYGSTETMKTIAMVKRFTKEVQQQCIDVDDLMKCNTDCTDGLCMVNRMIEFSNNDTSKNDKPIPTNVDTQELYPYIEENRIF
jgi:hypothetical protein